MQSLVYDLLSHALDLGDLSRIEQGIRDSAVSCTNVKGNDQPAFGTFACSVIDNDLCIAQQTLLAFERDFLSFDHCTCV